MGASKRNFVTTPESYNMPVKIFVGRLAEGTSRDDLTTLFKKYGEVVECDVISNYGFVHMNSVEEANAAIAALDGHNVKGSNIHVELSTAKTQGRKKRLDARGPGPSRGGMTRYEPYPPPAVYPTEAPSIRNMGPLVPDHQTVPPHREEYASEQVKDLLELYFRDPIAFDQYAKTYYYGERMERMARLNKHPPEYYPPPSTSARRFV